MQLWPDMQQGGGSNTFDADRWGRIEGKSETAAGFRLGVNYSWAIEFGLWRLRPTKYPI
jgi:hypothetical protein